MAKERPKEYRMAFDKHTGKMESKIDGQWIGYQNHRMIVDYLESIIKEFNRKKTGYRRMPSEW